MRQLIAGFVVGLAATGGPAHAFCFEGGGIKWEDRIVARLEYLTCLLNDHARAIDTQGDNVRTLAGGLDDQERRIRDLESQLIQSQYEIDRLKRDIADLQAAR